MDFTLNQPLSIDVNKITHTGKKHTATHDEQAHQTAAPNYSM